MEIDNKVDRHFAIRNTHPTVVTISGDTEALDENGIAVALDESLISTEMDRLQAEYDALAYARKREAEYPKIGDQLDKIYHEGIDAWKADMITPIKNKYPKG
jgi:hypothetical protein